MAKSNDIRVVLVRCGRTAWDDANRLQGRTDLPLSESGREAAAVTVRDLIAALEGAAFGPVYSGPDEASLQTAEMLGEGVGSRVKAAEELCALDLGVWDGLLETQLMERFPTAYREWKERPASVNPPEGETFEEGESRIRRSVCRLLEKANGKPVAFVLRPIPYAMVSLWLNGGSLNEIWTVLEDGPQSQQLTASREKIKSTMDALKANA